AREPLGGRDEVVERELLLLLGGRPMPRLAILASAADVRDRIDAAALEPGDDPGPEARRARDAEAAVAVEDGGPLAVKREALLGDEEHRDLGAVLARVEDLLGLEV